MVRWEPGARERLQAAALELFATRGFEQVTAAEIAQSVGLTERTFFRHFSDKREVLFYGQQQFLQAFVGGVDAAPPDASPLEIIASALHAAASFFPDERRPYSRMRQSVIDQNPALRERELHKLASLAATVAQALRARGIGEPTAALAAESGATVFGIAFAQWIREGETRSLSDIASDVLHELLNLTGAATGPRNLPVVGTACEPGWSVGASLVHPCPADTPAGVLPWRYRPAATAAALSAATCSVTLPFGRVSFDPAEPDRAGVGHGQPGTPRAEMLQMRLAYPLADRHPVPVLSHPGPLQSPCAGLAVSGAGQ